jgi:cytochrome b involved in lipid metabolism
VKRALMILLLLTFLGSSSAQAHQPVVLLNTDTTAARGPLLLDGTVSFAVRASFLKAGEKKAFRADLNAGDALAIQYLIVDKKPENTLKNTQLPQLVVTSPSGKSLTLKFTERIKFYEPYGKTNYLYLSRYSAAAEAGTYSFTLTARAKSSVTIAVGEREVPGEVIRGIRPSATPTPTTVVATPTASPKPTATATPTAIATPTATPSPTPTVTKAGYTMADVKKANTSAKCWSVIDGYVYDLTKWIPVHRGGPQAITFLCGKDGTSAFKAQHDGSSGPVSVLSNYLLGPLTP